MRLIDADALIDDLKYDVRLDEKALEFVGSSDGASIQFDKDCKDNAIDLLEHAPTVELDKEAIWYKPTGMMPPEYHGHYECSNCGGWVMRTWHHRRMVLTPYCPWCGALMKNGNTEENE